MPIDPSIIGNVMVPRAPNMPDVNAMMQTRQRGMENMIAMERQREADALAAQEREQEATARALAPAIASAFSDPSDEGLAVALSMVPPQYRDAAKAKIDQLRAIPDLNRRKDMIRAALVQDASGQAILAQLEPTANMRLQADTAARAQALREREIQAQENQAVMPRPMTAAEQARIDLDERKFQAELEKEAREAEAAGPGGVKLGPGERATPEGTVELIPGTKAYNAAAKAHTSDKKDAAIVVDKITAAKDKLKYILSEENRGGFEYNFGGYWAAYVGQNMPTEAAQNTYAKLESLKADLKGAGLEQLRAGGSIGQITEAEWPIIEKQMDSITPYMGEQAARDALVKIQRRLDNIAERATEAYDMQWGGTQFYSPVKAKGTGGGARVIRYDSAGKRIQ